MATEPLIPAEPAPDVKPGEPYCGNCGYSLVGATETNVCPECGKPLVEVLQRGRIAWRGRSKRYRSEATLFGLPVLDIAYGPDGDDQFGTARGIIAMGDRATGLLAIGGRAKGVVAIGGVSIGGAAIGGASLGVVSMGGAAAGVFAVGGGAAGGFAVGGGAVGIVSHGGLAIGIYARGGGAYGVHTYGPAGPSSPHAVKVFDGLAWVIGAPGPQHPTSMVLPLVHGMVVTLVLTIGIGVLALWGHRRRQGPARRSGS